MGEFSKESMINIEKRQQFIMAFPCFSAFSLEQRKELSELMREVSYHPKEVIVTENDIVDSVYIIAQGEAEVTRESNFRKRVVQVPVATLHAGEGIGLNDTGFYSTTGKRTATVMAVTEMILLRLDIKDLYMFLKKHQLEGSMVAASEQMLRMRFIKQSLPFSKLSHDRLRWLAEHVEEISLPAGNILFLEGEQGDKCYLVRSGQVEVFVKNENNQEVQLAILKPPVLFGEATLIARTPRNATARTISESDLLILRHEHLSELIESEDNVAKMFMTLMVDRSRPIQNEKVTVHHRTTADGQELTILKNPNNSTYFKLSQEGYFIWAQLDGKHTLQDITLGLAEKFNVFAPDVVAGLISKLTRAGFINNLELDNAALLKSQPVWMRTLTYVRRIMDKRIAFGDADPWVTKIYDKYIKYIFTRTAQFILLSLFFIGFYAFIIHAEPVLMQFSKQPASLLMLLMLIPLSFIELLMHELGHAFAVKSVGREVHYIGVGWSFAGPVAFTDTSDMWLANRKARIFVNMAGVYVDVIVAGLVSLSLLLVSNSYLQCMLWLFALYTYIGAFRMLSPLQEMDGYYALMDWLEKNRLRQLSVLWIVKVFPKALREPTLFSKHRAEIIYWLVCIGYLFLVTSLTLLIQTFVFKAIGISVNRYVSLILPFLVLLFSSLSVIVEIKQQAEE